MYSKEKYLVEGRCSLVDLLAWGTKASWWSDCFPYSSCSTGSCVAMSFALSSLGSSSISSSSFLGCSNDEGISANSIKSSLIALDWLVWTLYFGSCVFHLMASSIFIWKWFYLLKKWLGVTTYFCFIFLREKQNKKEKP